MQAVVVIIAADGMSWAFAQELAIRVGNPRFRIAREVLRGNVWTGHPDKRVGLSVRWAVRVGVKIL